MSGEVVGRGVKKSGVVCALTVLATACAPLVYPINYRSIRGSIGYFLNAPPAPPCAAPTLLLPASVEEGSFPRGLELMPDGRISGRPTAAGHWHAMVRLPRVKCGERVLPDRWVTVNFDVAEPPTLDDY
jgi:hypothetical protein